MKQISVLIIEDSIYAADLNVRQMKKAGVDVDFAIVASSTSMKESLLSRKWDLIISDNSIPNFNALQALDVRNEVNLNIPFIIVSEQISKEELEIAQINQYNGYVPKENLSLLRDVVKSLLNLE